MRGMWREFKGFVAERREWVMLPLLLILLAITIVIIFNRDVVHVPFVYSGF